MKDLVSWAFGILAFIGFIATLVTLLLGMGVAAIICGAATIVCGFGMFATAAAA